MNQLPANSRIARFRRIWLACYLPGLATMFYVAWQSYPAILDFVVSQDEKTVVAICGSAYSDVETSLHVWDLEAEQRKAVIQLDRMGSWAFSTDGTKLGLRSESGKYLVFDLTTMTKIHQWQDDEDVVRSFAAVSCDGESVVTSPQLVQDRPPRGLALDCWNTQTGKRTTFELFDKGDVYISQIASSTLLVSERLIDREIATAYRFGPSGMERQENHLAPAGVELVRPSRVEGNTLLRFKDRFEVFNLHTQSTVSTVRLDHIPEPHIFLDSQLSGNLEFIAAEVLPTADVFLWSTETGKLVRRVSIPQLNAYPYPDYRILPITQQLLFATETGDFHRVDWNTNESRTFPNRRWITYGLVVPAILWGIGWFVIQIRLPPRHPLVALFLLHLLILGPLFVHAVRSPNFWYSETLLATACVAELASLAVLLFYWLIHGHNRWSFRLAATLGGGAGLLGLTIPMGWGEMESVAWMMLVGSTTLVLTSVALFATQRWLGSRNVHAENQTTDRTLGSQLPLRDVFLLIAAVAACMAVLRLVEPESYLPPTTAWLASNGFTLAVSGVVACWAATGSSHWILRGLIFVLLPAWLGLWIGVLFEESSLFETPFYVMQHSLCAALVFVSLLSRCRTQTAGTDGE